MSDAEDVYLVEIAVWDPTAGGGSGAEVTLRYSTGRGHVTGPAETPASAFYDPRLQQPFSISRTMFAPRATYDRATTAFGDIVLNNEDGELDVLGTYGLDGRVITVRRGTKGAAYPAGFPAVFVGTMAGVDFPGDQTVIKLRDRQQELLKPIQPTKYAGNNALPAGLEGVEDLKGKPKPLCFGKVFNVPAPCVNTSKLIYQVHDGAIASVDAVYDRGVAIKPTYPPMILAVGDNGMYSSSDGGANWTERTDTFTSGAQGRRTAYGGGLWVNVGLGSDRIQISRDGISWQQITLVTTGPSGSLQLVDAAYNSNTNRWFVLGNFGTAGKLFYSDDDWLSYEVLTYSPAFGSFLATRDLLKFLANEVLFVVSSATSQLWRSTDGLNWQGPIAVTGANSHTGMAFGNNVFVLVGFVGASTPVLSSSSDGFTFTSRSAPASHTDALYRDIAFGNGILVTVGHNAAQSEPRIATSTNGITWTAQTADDTTIPLRGVAFDPASELFYAVGGDLAGNSGHIETSPDGITWTTSDDLSDTDLPDGFFKVSVGEGGTPSAYANTTDLLDDALAPVAGKFKPYLAGGYFRLGATPAGLITADVSEGAAAANRYAAQLFTRVLTKAGKSSSDWSSADVTALDTAAPYQLGVWIFDEVDVANVLDRIAGSVGASWFPDGAGIYRIQQLVAAAGSPVLELSANDLLRPLTRMRPNDRGQGIPVYQAIVRYARNYAVQSDDVASNVSAARRALIGKEWLEAKATDATVQTKHLLAEQTVEESLLALEADAQDEADRRQALRGAQRWIFELVLAIDDDTSALELNKVIDLTHNRFGLSAGEKFVVLGIQANGQSREQIVHAWGPN